MDGLNPKVWTRWSSFEPSSMKAIWWKQKRVTQKFSKVHEQEENAMFYFFGVWGFSNEQCANPFIPTISTYLFPHWQQQTLLFCGWLETDTEVSSGSKLSCAKFLKMLSNTSERNTRRFCFETFISCLLLTTLHWFQDLYRIGYNINFKKTKQTKEKQKKLV